MLYNVVHVFIYSYVILCQYHTLDEKNPVPVKYGESTIIYRVFQNLRWLAGFLPSTVSSSKYTEHESPDISDFCVGNFQCAYTI